MKKVIGISVVVMATSLVLLFGVTSAKASIVNCHSVGTVDPSIVPFATGISSMFCTTDSPVPGVGYISPDGTTLSLSALKDRRSSAAGGWSSNGQIEGAAGKRLTVKVDVTQMPKGKTYARQYLIPSWDGVVQPAKVVDAVKGTSSFYVDVPQSATNVWFSFITEVGGSRANVSEKLVSVSLLG